MADAPPPPLLLFATTVLSQCVTAYIPVIMWRHRWPFEFCVTLFAIVTSVMYHTCQSFKIKIGLDELQWHRLDNIAAISCFGIWFTYLCCFKDPHVDQLVKIVTFMLTVIVQEPWPWDVRFTVAPIVAYLVCLPVATGLHRLWRHGRWPPYDWRNFAIGVSLLLASFYFFYRGLDDDNDQWRLWHGGWHVASGLASVRLWMVVKQPINHRVVRHLATIDHE